MDGLEQGKLSNSLVCNSFLWRYLKSSVYEIQPTKLDDIYGRLFHEMRSITSPVRRNVLDEFETRLGVC